MGYLAENIVARYLEDGGYKVTSRNYQKPWGEIDIIAKEGDVFVFVEVKANSKDFEGNFNPELRVDEKKIQKIKRTASLFLEYEVAAMDSEWRIDVVSVVFDYVNKKAKIKHFKNI